MAYGGRDHESGGVPSMSVARARSGLVLDSIIGRRHQEQYASNDSISNSGDIIDRDVPLPDFMYWRTDERINYPF
jgi:hypothetical protein